MMTLRTGLDSDYGLAQGAECFCPSNYRGHGMPSDVDEIWGISRWRFRETETGHTEIDTIVIHLVSRGNRSVKSERKIDGSWIRPTRFVRSNRNRSQKIENSSKRQTLCFESKQIISVNNIAKFSFWRAQWN